MNSKYSSSNTPSSAPTYDEIALRAHQIWMQQGCPHGHDVDNWVEAEGQLLSERHPRGNVADKIERDVDLTPPSEDVPYGKFKKDAPLATRVAEETVEPGRPRSPNSKTALDL